MAILTEWGGPQPRLKSQQLAADLFTLLTQSKEELYIDDVEDFLDDAMLSLDTELDDGSIEEARSDSDDDDINGNHDGNAMSDNDGSSMMVDTLQLRSNSNRVEMAVDEPRESALASAEGGWTVVDPKRNGGRRN